MQTRIFDLTLVESYDRGVQKWSLRVAGAESVSLTLEDGQRISAAAALPRLLGLTA